MLAAQGTLRGNPRCRQRLNRSGDILAAPLAANHKSSLIWWSLKHDSSIGEYKAKVIHRSHSALCSNLIGFEPWGVASVESLGEEGQQHDECNQPDSGKAEKGCVEAEALDE